MNETLDLDLPGEEDIPESLFGYTILGYLGRGAGSVLYYGKHPKTSKIFVLKRVILNQKRGDRFYEQLETEYQLGRRLNHPYIRRSIEMHVHRPWFKGITEAALVMEHCDGYTLEERVPADNAERLLVFLRAAVAIAALHDAGYVHCDLKPGNFVVKAQGYSTLIDLGQACPIGTVKKRIQGTANFMAPEQAACSALTPQTDVYCFGATMYMALTRTALPTVMNAEENMKKRSSSTLEGVTRAPHAIDATIPVGLSALVMECVRAKPHNRPADMHQVVNALKSLSVDAWQRREAGL